MLRQTAEPCNALSPWIAHYWHWHLPASVALPELFPGTGGELLCNLGGNLLLDVMAAESGIMTSRYLVKTGDMVLLSPRRCRLRLSSAAGQPDIRFISARLRCGTAFPLFGLSLEELSDNPLFLADIRLKHPTPLLLGIPFISQVHRLERWLVQMLGDSLMHLPHMTLAANRLYYGEHVSTVREALALNPRTMERRIRHFIGVDARYFCRTARFQHTLRQILAGHPVLDSALEQGYTDQPHFIKTCRFFTGLTPGELFTAEHQALNYYVTLENKAGNI
ncbi:AraC family transcriptional regulator [Limnobaculum zhutongyuii]|uniref:AraC family transcriptional regulator n=1 Tax=Limnobaculum zhutongyuii TaxID=2498113 RepID=A0A411WNA1_9GAMM|nr:helix-turn-helix domain-containing protein [Limnobaculum zhutongyuii]QBH97610.1 AraC family transcriptional regulator [Limnobaculum zhutongyuii]TQS91084.1 AraC family transcriptional regulator [Limnobaculum zhutongyuii]